MWYRVVLLFLALMGPAHADGVGQLIGILAAPVLVPIGGLVFAWSLGQGPKRSTAGCLAVVVSYITFVSGLVIAGDGLWDPHYGPPKLFFVYVSAWFAGTFPVAFIRESDKADDD